MRADPWAQPGEQPPRPEPEAPARPKFSDPAAQAIYDTMTGQSEPAKPTAAAPSPPPEPPAGPYLGDDGELRDPAGHPVDVLGEDWWSEPWYGQARDLLVAAGFEHTEPGETGDGT